MVKTPLTIAKKSLVFVQHFSSQILRNLKKGIQMTEATRNSYDMILKGGTVVLPGLTTKTDIGIVNGKIEAIGNLSGAEAQETIE